MTAPEQPTISDRIADTIRDQCPANPATLTGCRQCTAQHAAVMAVIGPELDAKDLEIAEAHDALMANLKRAETAEAERDQFADAIAWEIQLHTQSTGPHQDLDLPACQRCRTYRELRELPAVRAASERLRQGIADAIRDGLAIVCRSPREDQ